MADLPPDQRRKLARVLALLSSSNPNEQVAAADRAVALLRKYDVSWEQLLLGPVPADIRQRTQPYTPPPRRPQPDVRAMIRECEAWSADLTGWEVEFLASVKRRREPLTENQLSALYRIHDRVSRWQSAWGTAS